MQLRLRNSSRTVWWMVRALPLRPKKHDKLWKRRSGWSVEVIGESGLGRLGDPPYGHGRRGDLVVDTSRTSVVHGSVVWQCGLEAIRKENAENQATFLFFLGYLNAGLGLFGSGFNRRTICWIAAICTQVSLDEVLYS